MNAVEMALSWVDDEVAAGTIELSTADDYRKSIRSWSNYIPEDPTRQDVDRGVRAMVREGRAPSTIRKRLVTMRRAYQSLVWAGLVTSNPFDGVRKPKVARSEKNYLPVEERERLKARISSQNSRLMVASALALYAGLREAEICALRCRDIELERSVGWVRSSIGRDGGKFYVKEPKNGRMRDFPIPEPLSMTIARWMDTNSARGNDYLLTLSQDFMNPVVLGRLWSSLCEVEGFVGVLGKRPTFHDLRHTYATVAISAGVDVKTVSSVLGHSSAAMTLDVYAVADPIAKRTSAEVLARVI